MIFLASTSLNSLSCPHHFLRKASAQADIAERWFCATVTQNGVRDEASAVADAYYVVELSAASLGAACACGVCPSERSSFLTRGSNAFLNFATRSTSHSIYSAHLS